MSMPASTRDLLKAVKEGDKEAKQKLVELNIPLVWSIVNRFRHTQVEKADLFQIGCVGLIKSIDHFDLSFDVQFSTYAVPIILSEIKKYFRDEGAISVSRGLKELNQRINKTKEEFWVQEEREPSLHEIAKKLNMPTTEIIMAMEASFYPTSLNEVIYEKDGSTLAMEDCLSTDEHEFKVNLMTLKDEIEKLNPREKLIINLRYYEELNQSEVAIRLGVSQVQISRLEKKIIEKLRQQFV